MTNYSLFGKFILQECRRKTTDPAKPYTYYKLALDAHVAPSYMHRILRGANVSAAVVNRICDTLEVDDRRREAMLNAAGYASPRQQKRAARLLKDEDEDEEPSQGERLRLAG
jgi:hypothetical protein